MAGEIGMACRGLRHAWDFYNPVNPKPSKWPLAVYLRCQRCTSARHDFYDNDGYLRSRRYLHVEGYKMTKDEKPTTEDVRKWMADRYRSYQRQLAA